MSDKTCCPKCGATGVPTGHFEQLNDCSMTAFYVTECYTFFDSVTGQRWIHTCSQCKSRILDDVVESASIVEVKADGT